jgi:Rad3-related DNA helicase
VATDEAGEQSRELLELLTQHLPGGEPRESQQRMVAAVSDAVRAPHHLLVQAGTGVGKSVGYLVPLVAAGRRTRVSTATKALQEQLVGKDLPVVADAAERVLGRRPSFALLKGRGNYYCWIRGGDPDHAAQRRSPRCARGRTRPTPETAPTCRSRSATARGRRCRCRPASARAAAGA